MSRCASLLLALRDPVSIIIVIIIIISSITSITTITATVIIALLSRRASLRLALRDPVGAWPLGMAAWWRPRRRWRPQRISDSVIA